MNALVLEINRPIQEQGESSASSSAQDFSERSGKIATGGTMSQDVAFVFQPEITTRDNDAAVDDQPISASTMSSLPPLSPPKPTPRQPLDKENSFMLKKSLSDETDHTLTTLLLSGGNSSCGGFGESTADSFCNVTALNWEDSFNAGADATEKKVRFSLTPPSSRCPSDHAPVRKRPFASSHEDESESNSNYYNDDDASFGKDFGFGDFHYYDDEEEEDPVTIEYYPGISPLTEQEKVQVWWQPRDFKLFRHYCKKGADYARQTPEFVNPFTQAYDECCAGASHAQFDDDDRLLQEYSNLSRSHARGLEVVVFPALVQARRLVVKGVVSAQATLRTSVDCPDERAKLLRATSKCLSGRARLLARVYGVTDEDVAKDCYYSMAQKEATTTTS